MSTRVKKERRKNKQTPPPGWRVGTPVFDFRETDALQETKELLRHERFPRQTNSLVQQLLDEGYTWAAAPRSALSGIRVDGEPYILPMETVVDGQPHHLVFFHEEQVYESQVGSVREMGLLIEDPECDAEKFMIYPVLVPTETIPANYRGQLVNLSSPAYTAKALSVVRRLPEGSLFRAVVNTDHWWFETAGSAVENAISLAYELHLGRRGVA